LGKSLLIHVHVFEQPMSRTCGQVVSLLRIVIWRFPLDGSVKNDGCCACESKASSKPQQIGASIHAAYCWMGENYARDWRIAIRQKDARFSFSGEFEKANP
jgi:hypothetical protein